MSGPSPIIRYAHWYCIVLAICSIANGQEKVVAFDPTNFSHLPDNQIVLLDEFYKNYTKLKAFYQDIQYSGRIENFREKKQADDLPIAIPPTDLMLNHRIDFDYYSRQGEYFRFDIDVNFFNNEGKTIKHSRNTGIIQPEESFLFGYDDEAEEYYLLGHGKKQMEAKAQLYFYIAPCAAFSSGPQLLEYIVFAPDSQNRIESVTLTDATGGRLATIRTKFEDSDFTSRNTIRLWRDRYWAVKEIHYESRTVKEQGIAIHQTTRRCGYDGQIEGYPLLKSFEEVSASGYDSGDRLLPYKKLSIQFEDFETGRVNLNLFDPKKIMPDLGHVGNQQSDSYSSWILLLNGIVLLVIGLFLVKRRQKASQHEDS